MLNPNFPVDSPLKLSSAPIAGKLSLFMLFSRKEPTNSSLITVTLREFIVWEFQIIVDMWEFMSSLPNILHQKGMRIMLVTLEVGDYHITPLICVERKSIQDHFQSFASGRQYNQVEMMVQYYRIHVLLIKFSQDKSLSPPLCCD